MSDGEDYGSPEALQPNGASNGRQHTPSHRKGPRFSWTPAYEATFFRSLCESVKLGLKDNHSFKQEAWDRAVQALAERHAAYPNKGHLINKSDNARKKFRLWRGLREDPEFLYNPNARTVTASEDAWRAHIEVSRRSSFYPYLHATMHGGVDSARVQTRLGPRGLYKVAAAARHRTHPSIGVEDGLAWGY